MKQFIKGAILASSLLGMYSVAEHIQQPSAYVAEAASYSSINNIMQSALRQEANRLGKTYHSFWFNVSKVTGAYISTYDGKMGILRDYWPDSYGLDGNVIGGGTIGSTKYAWCNNGQVYQYSSSYPFNSDTSLMTAFGTDGISIIQSGYGSMDGGYWYRTDKSNLVKQLRSALGWATSPTNKPKPKPKASKTYRYNAQLTAKSSNYKLFGNKTFSKTKGKTKSGRVYQAKGYFNYKGKRYYSLYQKDSKNHWVWRGYANSGALTKVNKYTSNTKWVIKKGNYSRWDNLYFSKKRGTTSSYKGKIVTAKYGYKLGNGKTYYSVYSGKKWLGYIEKSALQHLTSSKGENKKVTMTGKKYSLWKDLSLGSKKGYATQGKVYQVKHSYKLGGKIYYSVYQNDSRGKSVWKGYLDSRGVKTLNAYHSGNQFVVSKGNYSRWDNLYFSKKRGTTSSYKGKIVTAKYGYKLGNGKTYYSVYSGKKWLGYIEKGALVYVSSKSMDKTMTMTGGKYSLWSHLAFSSRKGYATKGQVYQAKREYTLSGGKKYYSVYTKDSKAQWVWRGYVDAKGIKPLSSEAVNKKAVIKNSDAGRWNNLYFTNKRGKASDYKGKHVEIRRIYTLGDGKKYYSVYTSDNQWLGYIISSALDAAKVQNKLGVIYFPEKTTIYDMDGHTKTIEAKSNYHTQKLYTFDGEQYYLIADSQADGKPQIPVGYVSVDKVQSVKGKSTGYDPGLWIYTEQAVYLKNQWFNGKTIGTLKPHKKYYVKYTYDIEGETFYSVYSGSEEEIMMGEDLVWLGYVNAKDVESY